MEITVLSLLLIFFVIAIIAMVIILIARKKKSVDIAVVRTWQDVQNVNATFTINKKGKGVYSDASKNLTTPIKVTANCGFIQIAFERELGNGAFNYQVVNNAIMLYQNGVHVSTLQRIG